MISVRESHQEWDVFESTKAGLPTVMHGSSGWNRGLHWLLLLVCLQLGLGLAHAEGNVQVTAPAVSELDDSYRLSPGDQISVQVYGENELSKEYSVGANGRISFPFIGELPVARLTSKQVGSLLADALRGTYLIDPKVTVTVIRYLPIYLNGQVKSPGAHDYEPGLTVRKAITLAGGFTDRASTRRIYLVPANQPEGAQPRKVGLEQPVQPGDTITVEESFF